MAVLGVVTTAGLSILLLTRPGSGGDTSSDDPAPGSPIVLDGVEGQVIENLTVSNPAGDCIQIRNARGIELRNLKIGPCQGRGILLENAEDIVIEGNTVESGYSPPTCCDLGSGILVLRSTVVEIVGNTLSRNETNIEVISSQGVSITQNRLMDPLGPFPRGQQIQLVPVERPVSDVLIAGNTMVCSGPDVCNQEDAINVHGAVQTTIRDNLIVGGYSASGCGIILENDAADVYVGQNYLYETGNCGIGVAGGRRHLIEDNHVLLTQEVAGGGNVAIYVWLIAGTCGEVVLRNNVASFLRRDGSHNAFWDGGGCRITSENNVFGAAALGRLTADKASVLMERLTP